MVIPEQDVHFLHMNTSSTNYDEVVVSAPVYHVLKPHHINILRIILAVFGMPEFRYPSEFTLLVERILLQEVTEVSEAMSYNEFMFSLNEGKDWGDPEISQLLRSHREKVII